MEVLVYKAEITPHPNADKLELCNIGLFQAIVPKGRFKTGDLVVYIPTGAVVPSAILDYMGLLNKLSGPNHDVVKAIRLRGVLSEGLILDLHQPIPDLPPVINWTLVDFSNPNIVESDCIVSEGQDVSEILGIKKHEQPMLMQSTRFGLLPEEFRYNYDIENYKKVSGYFHHDMTVVITEKIHGTLLAVCAFPDGRFYVASKGVLSRGQYIIEPNLYTQITKRYDLNASAFELANMYSLPVTIFCEIFGPKVQDLPYLDQVGCRVFDIRIGHNFLGQGEEFHEALKYINVHQVPVLYRGRYDHEIVTNLTVGNELVSGEQRHIREGVVVRPVREQYTSRGNRIIAKSINEAYLLRKDGTEYN